MKKYTLERSGFDLQQTDNRWVVPIPRGAAVVVTGRKEIGAWSVASLTVRQVAGGAGYDFATPRTIPVGGTPAASPVRIASAEMEGCEGLELKMAVAGLAGVEASAGTALLTVTVEEPE